MRKKDEVAGRTDAVASNGRSAEANASAVDESGRGASELHACGPDHTPARARRAVGKTPSSPTHESIAAPHPPTPAPAYTSANTQAPVMSRRDSSLPRKESRMYILPAHPGDEGSAGPSVGAAYGCSRGSCILREDGHGRSERRSQFALLEHESPLVAFVPGWPVRDARATCAHRAGPRCGRLRTDADGRGHGRPGAAMKRSVPSAEA
jgi:hypothetical protein